MPSRNTPSNHRTRPSSRRSTYGCVAPPAIHGVCITCMGSNSSLASPSAFNNDAIQVVPDRPEPTNHATPSGGRRHRCVRRRHARQTDWMCSCTVIGLQIRYFQASMRATVVQCAVAAARCDVSRLAAIARADASSAPSSLQSVRATRSAVRTPSSQCSGRPMAHPGS